MTDHNTPIAADSIRVIVQDGEGHRTTVEYPTAHLPSFLDFSKVCPLREYTMEGALNAAAIYHTAMRKDNGMVANAAALWICLYGTDLPDPLRGLRLADLQCAAGDGVMTIGVQPDYKLWMYLFKSTAGEVGGAVMVDVPDWSKGTVGSA